MGQPILFEHKCAAGDVVVMSGAIRDLALTHPGMYDIHVHTSCSSLWKHNPHIVQAHGAPRTGMRRLRLTYGRFIPQANRQRWHFARAFHRDIEEQLKVDCPVLLPHGDLHLDEYHRTTPPIDGRYWYIITGGKSDFTTKVWSSMRWQQTINILRQFGIRFVQDGALHEKHWQPPMRGVLSTVNRTNLRDMLWLIYHADGIIVPVTAAMHMAACFNKPCVVIAGGREHWWWEAYVANAEQFGSQCQPVQMPHRYLHTQGLLDCCKDRGCWKNKVSRREPDNKNSYCKLPVIDDNGQELPKCLLMIEVAHVTEAVMSYYRDGEIPPIGKPRPIILPDGQPVVPGTLSENAVAVPPTTMGLPNLFAITAAPAPPPTPAALPEPQQVQQFEQETTKTATAKDTALNDICDHPVIGGRVTICVLLYGDHYELHRRCLNSIISTVHPARMQLRVAANEPCSDTLKYLSRLDADGRIHKTYVNQTNIKKYPAMRQLFYDADDPITDKYVIWFDDDSIADRDMQWFTKLCTVITQNHGKKYRYYGTRFIWNFSKSQIEWIRSRPWYRNRRFQMKNGLESPNGDKVVFATGGFWAAEMATIRKADVPDEQIGHNGGDYIVGEQLWQAGSDLKDWNRNKKFVHTSSVKRRGITEVHTGQKNWQPGGVPK